MVARPKTPWFAIGSFLLIAVSGGALFFWRLSMQAIDQEVERKKTALKSLHVGGRLPPNQEVMDYLTSRTKALETRYQAALHAVTSTPSIAEGHADPQLYFQQRFHEVQRTLERLAMARGMTAPLQLGFPKELPPSDVVPRLLLQLDLIKDASELILPQGVTQLISVKAEDPESVPFGEDGKGSFVTRLPVRFRLTCSLDTWIKLVGMLERAKPLIDFKSVRITASQTSADLDVECVLARYLATAPQLEEPESEKPQKTSAVSRQGSSS